MNKGLGGLRGKGRLLGGVRGMRRKRQQLVMVDEMSVGDGCWCCKNGVSGKGLLAIVPKRTFTGG